MINQHKGFPSLDSEKEHQLITNLSQWCLGNGLTMYPPSFDINSAIHAPVTLFPTPFPRCQFEKAVRVQQNFNKLYANIVVNVEWLGAIIETLSTHDKDFTGKLWETYQQAKQKGIKQEVSLGLFRSDYMLDETSGSIKQIEFNTVSVSFGGLSPKVAAAHRYLNRSGDYADAGQHYDEAELPDSDSADKLSVGLSNAVNYYNNSMKTTDTIVLFIVQNKERNVFDQRALDNVLVEKYGIKCVRMTLEEVNDKVSIDQEGRLSVKSSGNEVSVVYYRSGYGPSDYSCPRTWEARLLLETTMAVKAPSLLTQLSGVKKTQQILTDKSVVKTLLPQASESDIDDLMSTFVAIHSLDLSEGGAETVKLAMNEAEKYVLKPQREGGGNNVYKETIPSFLSSIPKSDWAAYILMEMISPASHENKILREGKVYHENVISELGIFGTILFNEKSGDILQNDNAGWLLRSKFSSSNEGGVAAGFGCIDSVYLY